MSVLADVLEANDRYATSFGDKGELALPPARRFALLTSLEPRLDPAQDAGPPGGPPPRTATTAAPAPGWAEGCSGFAWPVS